MKSPLLFVVTGISSVTGGISASNLNVLHALEDVAGAEGFQLSVLSFMEKDEDRPPFLSRRISFKGFRRRKLRLAVALLSRLVEKPIFIFDHVALAAPLLPFSVIGIAKTIIFAHGSESWKRMRRGGQWSFRFATLCLANSNFTLNKMRKSLPKFNGVACPLGLSPIFSSNGKKISLLSQKNLELEAVDGKKRPLGKQFLLLVARMLKEEGRKGQRPLIKVLPHLLTKFPDVQLVFPGPGDDRKNLQRLALEQNVASSVFLPGLVSLEMLKDLYANCYAFVMPSQQEGFGMAYLEAMNYGKPCVGCFGQGAEEIIVHGQTGWLVQNPDDPRELTQTLSTLLSDPDGASLMGKKGFDRLHQFFTSAHYQERVKQQICSVLNQ